MAAPLGRHGPALRLRGSANSARFESKLPVSDPSAGESADEAVGEEDHEPELVVLLVAIAVGVAAGACVVLFTSSIHELRDIIWEGSALRPGTKAFRALAESEAWPRMVFPPVLGGLLVGALGLGLGGYEDGRHADGRGHEHAGDTLRVVRDALRPVGRAAAAVLTLGTGASLGPEAPAVDIGRSLARAFADRMRSGSRHLTSLLAAGAGAGVSAAFNAPISGVFFAVETVLQRAAAQRGPDGTAKPADYSALTIAMVLLAAVVAALISQAFLGSSPAFRVPEYSLESIYELPLYALFGIICGVVSGSFSYSARVASGAFEELKQAGLFAKVLMPAVGGLTTGLLALGYPEIMYQGFDNVNTVLSSSGDYGPKLLIQIVIMKVIATAICRGSGLQGGLYAPSSFIGAALGSAFGQLAQVAGEALGLPLSAPQAYALVGVGALLASNCAVPLTSVLLLFELTHDYLIIVPALATIGISYWVSSALAPSISTSAAAAAVRAAAMRAMPEEESGVGRVGRGLAEQSVDVLDMVVGGKELTVQCALGGSCVLLYVDTPLAEALELMREQGQQMAVVVGENGAVVGLVSQKMLKQLAEAQAAGRPGMFELPLPPGELSSGTSNGVADSGVSDAGVPNGAADGVATLGGTVSTARRPDPKP